jgi:hypothetical protein
LPNHLHQKAISSYIMAKGLTQPALAPFIFTGKQQTFG